VPADVSTVVSTVPVFVLAGLESVIWVAVSLSKLVTGKEPKSTSEAFARLVPVIVTGVPSAIGPDEGLISVMDGPKPGPGK